MARIGFIVTGLSGAPSRSHDCMRFSVALALDSKKKWKKDERKNVDDGAVRCGVVWCVRAGSVCRQPQFGRAGESGERRGEMRNPANTTCVRAVTCMPGFG